MSNLFEICIKINDQSFDICIVLEKSLISFCELFPKVKEVVKIGAKQDIDFKTHEFELFSENPKIVGLQIGGTDSIISGSVISITPKRRLTINYKEVVGNHESSVDQNCISNDVWRCEARSDPITLNLTSCAVNTGQILREKAPNYSTEESFLVKNIKQIQNFYSIVLAINIGWNFRVSDNLSVWQKVSAVVNAKRSQFQTLTPRDCSSSFNSWINYYLKNYYKLNGKIGATPQNIFDLLKVIHTLNFDKFFNDGTHILRKIKTISKTQSLQDYFHKHLNDIWLKKLNEMENQSIPQKCVSKRNSKSNYKTEQKKKKLMEKIKKKQIAKQKLFNAKLQTECWVNNNKNCLPKSQMPTSNTSANLSLGGVNTTVNKKSQSITRGSALPPIKTRINSNTLTVSSKSCVNGLTLRGVNTEVSDKPQNKTSSVNQTIITNIKKKVISLSDYKKLRAKSETKSGESLPPNDCNSLNSVQQIISKERNTEFMPNTDPRLPIQQI